jgi:hypothetical protein
MDLNLQNSKSEPEIDQQTTKTTTNRMSLERRNSYSEFGQKTPSQSTRVRKIGVIHHGLYLE